MSQPPDQPPIGIPGAQPTGPSLTKQGDPGPPPAYPSGLPGIPGPGYGAPAGWGPPPTGQDGGAALVLAGWGTRWAATLIDGITRFTIAFVISIVFFLLLSDDPFSTAAEQPDGVSNLGGLAIATFVIFHGLAFVFAPLCMAIWPGQSFGKRLTRIRVVTELGTPPNFGIAILRESIVKTLVLTWMFGWLFFPWLLNFLWPLWDDQSRAGHDFLVKTRVVMA